jgi:tripartite-type tricarboxylate transporter receptor subunit TctC
MLLMFGSRGGSKLRAIECIEEARLRSIVVGLTTAALFTAVHAAEQPYPTRPVRFIMPVAAGGGTDQLGRIVAQKMTEKWGQALVVDNRDGAGGTIGTDLAAKSAPDGYTLVMGYFAPIGVNVHLFKLPYDPVKDFDPITLLATSPNLLAVHPSVQAKTVKEFIALAKSKPGELHYGSGGSGSAMQLSAEMFNMMTGIKTTHVPYKGAAPALRDLLAGQVQLAFISVPSSLAQIKAGKVRPLAVAAAKRAAALPDTPTVDEAAGLRGFASYQWYGPLAPAKTPAWIISRLHHDFVEALNKPDVIPKLDAAGFDREGSTPAEFGKFIRNEIAKWGKVIKAANIKAE